MKSRLILALAATALVVERLLAWARAAPTDFDDAYMFVRYADAWLHGHGLRWNATEAPVYGATGLVHLLAVTALRALHAGDARAIMTASVGAAVLAVIALALLIARFAKDPVQRVVLAVVALPLVVCSDAFGFHTTTGMDTMSSLLANTLLAFAVLQLLETPTPRAAIGCAIASWIAIETRPDNAIVAVLAPLLAVRSRFFVATLMVLAGASLIAKKLYFGTALPLSFWAKRPNVYGGFVGEYTWNPFWFLAVFVRAAAPMMVVIGLGARRRHLRKLMVLLVPPLITMVGLFGLNQIMGHLGRFYLPFLAWLVAAAAVTADGIEWTPRRALITAVLLVGGVVGLQAAGRIYESRADTQKLAELGGYEIDAQEPLADRDSWQSSIEMAELAAAAPPGTRLAMTEHGLVAARAPQAIIIDMLGLHDRELALHGFSAAALLDRKPDLIWIPHPDYTQMIRDLYDQPRFWSDYDYWPDALTFGVALRRGSSPSLRALFEARFKADYPGARLDDYRARATSGR